jgi:hypothetical protein
MVHIPYRGTSQAMTDMLTGRVEMMFAPIVVTLPHIQSGALRGLSITSPDRSPLLPEVPTVREAGLPETETEVWIGLFAPARTPDIVIGTLYDGLVHALKMPAVRESFGREGSDVVVDASPAASAVSSTGRSQHGRRSCSNRVRRSNRRTRFEGHAAGLRCRSTLAATNRHRASWWKLQNNECQVYV